ncbi:MAG: hypothetical protein K2Y32_21650 [Candidatus Obscuribacterales bacterium]|nr:hypothetical protein [Candidatus Obscuribacterales bacterium]
MRRIKWLLSSALVLTGIMVGPNVLAADMQSGIKKYNAKDYQGALNDFKDVLKAKPNDGLCHYYMALCNQCLARIGEAKLHYQKVIDVGPASLKANAQAGLSQLDKVTVRYGGGTSASTSTSSSASSAPVVVASAAGAKDAKADAKTDGKPEAKKPNVKRIIMFYSDSSPGSMSMESTWDDAKQKYKDIEFTRLNVADPSNAEMLSQYGVSSYPTTVVIDQGGKVLHNQAGAILGDAFSSMVDGYLKKK